eukprot:TRINITY_DN24163_c0_g1_i1.p1 TRINITY_DN24163_c0_g1~~TRINITY_DN24163_c0_g1_i1.p1  ORF type:complete len:1944 (-),score=324.17 TRINITY_DN24163_c0_g1_i1:98-5167(-)
MAKPEDSHSIAKEDGLDTIAREEGLGTSAERTECADWLLPTPTMLRESIATQLSVPVSSIERFSAWLGTDSDHERTMNVEFAVQTPKGKHLAFKRKVERTEWRLGSQLPAPWDQAYLQQQPPAMIKAKGSAPGMDLLEMLERCSTAFSGKVEDEDKDSQALHLDVARKILEQLTSRRARFMLGLQYLCNLCAAGFLPYVGYLGMTSCDQGFPMYVHVMWMAYMCVSLSISLLVLRLLGGPRVSAFLKQFRWRVLFRIVSSFILLTDTYQDATFPVIANKCYFSLWFVSAWLVILGVGIMQVLIQVIVMITCALRYNFARTPEERDRWLVQGAFMALRGSDNLVLVYAVRPAVEERLGGASSWGMKLSEARVAFLRFMFEDVEQSALQAVFLIFYEDASVRDKIWVSASIATSLLLSFTMVVQCIPEVRDWLWHRILSQFPGCQRFRACRIPWFFLMLVFYRGLSTFPWISACSPTGDPCPTGDMPWYQSYWGCDADRKTTLFGLPARIKVVDEVLQTSSAGLIVISSTIALVSGAWWLKDHLADRNRKRIMGDVDIYDHRRRLLRSESAHEELLRPITDDDEDAWLETVRQLQASFTRVCAADLDPPRIASMKSLVQGIDHAAYKLSRAHLFPGIFWYPGDRWLTERSLPKKLDTLRFLAERTGLDGLTQDHLKLLIAEAKHTLRLSRVRRRVMDLLKSRGFIRASLEQKAWAIIDGQVGVPPLRLIHWQRIEALGYLPKFQMDGTGNGAIHIDELLEEVALRLKVGRTKAERHLVVFMLSHRWLRTQGRGDHHPDSEDAIKARKLVSFARWFKNMALRAGLLVDVAYWIDFCCCEQDDRHGVELSIAALPLYIASCTQVIAWRTPDFHRRCWTMVERVLSYSFCRGGLTPYVIDETFPEVDPVSEEDVVLGADGEAEVTWEVMLPEGWLPFDATAQAVVRSAKQAGLPKTVIDSGGRRYEIDLKAMTQRNTATYVRRPIRERRVPARGVTRDGPRHPSVSSAPAPGKSGRAASMIIEKGSQTVRRMARKLPNPLDPESCLITRDSHRRHIASLVRVALSVPAFEVFADRQPVEWGLTEVIEHSLTERDELPNSFAKDVPEPVSWLQAQHASDAGSMAGIALPNWKLVVLDTTKVRQRQQQLQYELDAIVWMDLGLKPGDTPPSLVEIDRLFQDVDDALLDGGSSRSAQEQALRALIVALKTDLTLALKSGAEDAMERAVIRAREVDLPSKQDCLDHLVNQRLLLALTSGSEVQMRSALRFAREKGAENLEAYKDVKELQEGLYKEQLQERLATVSVERNIDIPSLAAVYKTASSHGYEDIGRQVLMVAQAELKKAAEPASEKGIMAVARMQSEARASGWTAFETDAAARLLLLTMEVAVMKAAAIDDLAAMRAVEERARAEGITGLADSTAVLIKETAQRKGERMGLPAGWDVVQRLAGTDSARLLQKDEETEQALLDRIQLLVDTTYFGWGGFGAGTRTRDRGSEPAAKRLKVMSAVYVQNAESFVNYLARRNQVRRLMRADDAIGDAWDIKTASVQLGGVGRHKDNPVDKQINEHYLWHGCTPAAAKAITDDSFDLKRAGTAYGSLFGPGIYMAESCMKADEYTKKDERGFYPLLLCRATLGRINYCDHPAPVAMSAELEASCRPGGEYHSVLGDREKVSRTFREFILFDNHQVYAEYIVWYQRIY